MSSWPALFAAALAIWLVLKRLGGDDAILGSKSLPRSRWRFSSTQVSYIF